MPETTPAPALPTEAAAVVIGAGAFGLSVGLHLAERGVLAVVLDRFAPASQTSPRAAGLFRLVQASETKTRLARLSAERVERFEAQTGVPLPHVRSGSLLVARAPAHAAMIRAEAAASRAWGVEIEEVSPADAHRRCPWLEPDGLLAAFFTPHDRYVEEPATMLAAYQAAGERAGMIVRGHTPATAIRVESGRVAGVETPFGPIATETVVDAAGAWATQVGRLAGTAVPIAPMRHQLTISVPVPGVAPDQPIVRIVDAAVYARPARGGLMLGGFEADPLPLDPADQHPTWTMADAPLDLAPLRRMGAAVADQVPAAVAAPIAEHRGGLFTMSPDGRLLAGPVPDLPGLWLATGCNGSGFSLSPGVGLALAAWIADGAPPFAMDAVAPGRFAGTPFSDSELVTAGSYQYSHYYEPSEIPSPA
ncbi:MAG: hypothetical protein AVDCRST_MAG73-1855 [uncultured Thermomicrobiales bacterium]|uniref:FAD dependent oxidoreductase domain-containing protein n=1 Tax=uncultured Thermomicrobiales bacterium TaxID=1645740 RepID=A0A6J4U6B5_9BACT|nr:MAG: hypothetical protein AVDCRST_MAG73-1855 [uncultured Thermomicrobiales bacterium]